MEDMLSGLNEWRNIQTVVRSTFKQLHDILMAQDARIKSLEKVINRCPTMAQIEALQEGIENKPNFTDMEHALLGYNQKFEHLITAQSARIKEKVDKADMKDVYTGLSMVAKDVKNLGVLSEDVSSQAKGLRDVRKHVKLLEEKAENSELVFAKKVSIENSLARVQDHVLKNLSEALDAQDKCSEERLSFCEAQLKERCDKKLDISVFEQRIGDLSVEKDIVKYIDGKMTNLQSLNKDFRKTLLEETLATLDEKANKSDVKELIKSKVDKSEFEVFQENQVSMVKVEEEIEKVSSVIVKDVSQLVSELQNDIVPILNKKCFRAEVAKLLECKVDENHFTKLMSQKPCFSELNSAFVEKKELEALKNELGTSLTSKSAFTRLKGKVKDMEKIVTSQGGSMNKETLNNIAHGQTQEIMFKLKEASATRKELQSLKVSVSNISSTVKALQGQSGSVGIPKTGKPVDIPDTSSIRGLSKNLDHISEGYRDSLVSNTNKSFFLISSKTSPHKFLWSPVGLSESVNYASLSTDNCKVFLEKEGVYKISLFAARPLAELNKLRLELSNNGKKDLLPFESSEFAMSPRDFGDDELHYGFGDVVHQVSKTVSVNARTDISIPCDFIDDEQLSIKFALKISLVSTEKLSG